MSAKHRKLCFHCFKGLFQLQSQYCLVMLLFNLVSSTWALILKDWEDGAQFWLGRDFDAMQQWKWHFVGEVGQYCRSGAEELTFYINTYRLGVKILIRVSLSRTVSKGNAPRIEPARYPSFANLRYWSGSGSFLRKWARGSIDPGILIRGKTRRLEESALGCGC